MRLALLVVLAGCDRLLGLDNVPAAPIDAAPEIGHWTAVAAGEAHTCAVRDDSSLWCWGRNDANQIAAGSGTLEADTPFTIPGAWQTVATSFDTTCGIQTDGSLWCWGRNGYKQAGSGDGSMPSRIDGGPWLAVSVGYYFTCGLDSAHAVWCWGYDGNGELGTGAATAGVPAPTKIDSTRTFERIASGSSHTCAITDDDHTLWCWGYGAYGQQGTGDAVSHTSPTQVDDEAWTDIAGGYFHTCGLLADGRLRCWGYGPSGQLGNPQSANSYVPQPVGVDDNHWTHVYATTQHTCATMTDGSLWCWGENDSMQLANPSTPVVDPVPIMVAPGPPGWLAVALGHYHTCGIGGDHALWCTGNESGGRIGDGQGSTVTPQPVMNAPAATQIAAASDQTCVLDTAGTRWCWGINTSAQLGDGTLITRDHPTQMRGSGSMLALGDTTGCVLDAAMHLQCWGSSTYDEIDPKNLRHYVPYDMQPSLAPWTTVAITTHTCAIDATGVLYCWGYSGHGEVGAGTTATYTDPVPIAGGLYMSVAVGDTQTCGATGSGTSCWGYNYYGELGNNSQTEATTPAAVDAMVGPLAAAGSTTCQLVGTALRCWGYNGYGQLGVGDVNLRKVPTALTGTWRQIALGRNHACAIATDGTAWCWGRNLYGELGTGNMQEAHVPVQLGTAQWSQLAVGDFHSCGVQSDGSVWCWGNDGFGQLGADHLRLPYFRLP